MLVHVGIVGTNRMRGDVAIVGVFSTEELALKAVRKEYALLVRQMRCEEDSPWYRVTPRHIDKEFA